MESTATKSLTENQQKILRVLVADTNAKSPITGTNLTKRIGLYLRQGDERGGMRGIIHALRIKGFPVCANNKGYFYAKSDLDLGKFITKLQGRIDSQQKAIDGLKLSFHNVGKVSGDGKVEYVRRLPVRIGDAVSYKDFKLDEKGRPIIPEGVQLV
jgi:hypothetical protein